MEKYQYLLASLKGEVLNVVKNLPFSTEYYTIAYDLLLARYRNKRKLANHHLKSILEAKPLKSESADALHILLDTFTENTRHIRLKRYRDMLNSQSSSPKKSASVSSLATRTAECPVCKEQHLVFKCPRFLKLAPRKRHSTAKTSNLCLNCLRAGHGVNNCPSTWVCQSCKAKHHTLLHFERNSSSTSTPTDTGTSSESEAEKSSSPQNNEALVTMTSVVKSSLIVLLSTVQAEALDIHGNLFPVRILLDSASQLSFISETCMRKSGFGRTKHRTIVLAVNDTKAAATRGSTSS
ncbi:uncharacterized protein [Temnothorax nylanderi]|uniref:uncharacterized protein n=1 Tax=Temnothorax nylanderi TaxID=102681 RepID=UPI003A865D0C